jgi:hypothetical protein
MQKTQKVLFPFFLKGEYVIIYCKDYKRVKSGTISYKISTRRERIITLDKAITPSKLIALFLAVNKSSVHPEMSSCEQMF